MKLSFKFSKTAVPASAPETSEPRKAGLEPVIDIAKDGSIVTESIHKQKQLQPHVIPVKSHIPSDPGVASNDMPTPLAPIGVEVGTAPGKKISRLQQIKLMRLNPTLNDKPEDTKHSFAPDDFATAVLRGMGVEMEPPKEDGVVPIASPGDSNLYREGLGSRQESSTHKASRGH